MIAKQNFRKNKMANDENYVCHPNDTPRKVGKILLKLKKMWLQKSWKKSVLLTQYHPMRIPSTPQGPTIKAVYQK
jgi:hypothetical protein